MRKEFLFRVHDENDANTLTGDNFTLGQVKKREGGWREEEGRRRENTRKYD